MNSSKIPAWQTRLPPQMLGCSQGIWAVESKAKRLRVITSDRQLLPKEKGVPTPGYSDIESWFVLKCCCQGGAGPHAPGLEPRVPGASLGKPAGMGQRLRCGQNRQASNLSFKNFLKLFFRAILGSQQHWEESIEISHIPVLHLGTFPHEPDLHISH